MVALRTTTGRPINLHKRGKWWPNYEMQLGRFHCKKNYPMPMQHWRRALPQSWGQNRFWT
jgi:hypothetical protein